MANGDLKTFLVKSRMPHDYTNSRKQVVSFVSKLKQEQLLLFAKQIADGMAHIAAHQVRSYQWRI